MKQFGVLVALGLFLISSVSAQVKINPAETCPGPEGFILNRIVCRSNVDWKESNILGVLMNSFADTEVPGGVSIALKDGDARKEFAPDSFTLQGVLDHVITVSPGYQWSESGGVVNVFPLEDYEVLNLTVPEFEFENKTKHELLAEVIQTKQFRQYLKKYSVSAPRLLYMGGLQDPRPPRKFSISLKNATVRDILNEIVRLNGSSTWVYMEYESSWPENVPQKRYKLYFLVSNY